MVRTLTSCVIAAVLFQQPEPTRVYEDRGGRFSFSYPSRFGEPSTGTDDGFGDRIAAVRFEAFPAVFGKEAVLMRGFPLIDLQAVGGLYDELTLQIFPDALRSRVVAELPRLTAANFCAALGQVRHLDPDLPAFRSFSPQQRGAVGSVDVMRNANPHVVECRRDGDIITFDKERAFQQGSPVQHVYGAARFLSGPYSIFEFIAGGAAPDAAVLNQMTEVVRSFNAR